MSDDIEEPILGPQSIEEYEDDDLIEEILRRELVGSLGERHAIAAIRAGERSLIREQWARSCVCMGFDLLKEPPGFVDGMLRFMDEAVARAGAGDQPRGPCESCNRLRLGLIEIVRDMAHERQDTVWIGPGETLGDRVMGLLDMTDGNQLQLAMDESWDTLAKGARARASS